MHKVLAYNKHMEVNGITIPDEGTTRNYIPDAEGGHLYEVVTSISVYQHPIDFMDMRVSEVQAKVVDLQAEVAELEAQKSQIDAAVAANAAANNEVLPN